MSESSRVNRLNDCRVCGVAHDPEIHDATLSVHDWFRRQVTQYLYEEVAEEELPEVQVA